MKVLGAVKKTFKRLKFPKYNRKWQKDKSVGEMLAVYLNTERIWTYDNVCG